MCVDVLSSRFFIIPILRVESSVFCFPKMLLALFRLSYRSVEVGAAGCL